jgi:cytochrome c oxidase assembly protein subunit 15
MSVAELHAIVAIFLAGLIVAGFVALRLSTVPPAAHQAYAALLAATALQVAVGYSQYFTGLPTDLIETHIMVAGILVITAVRLNLALGQLPRRCGPAGRHRHDEPVVRTAGSS